MYHSPAQHTQHDQRSNGIRTPARTTTLSPSDTTPNKRTSIPTAAPVAVRWHRMVAPKPRSQSSGDVDTRLLTRRDNHSDQKDNDNIIMDGSGGDAPWLSQTYITQTSVAVGALRPRQLAATAGIHRRLCFSLDEKALFDLHNAQYSSTASQQQSSSEQSPQRTAMGPIKPPFAPPERVRTPDGVPSWPGVVETCAYTRQQQRAQLRDRMQGAKKKRRGGAWSKLKARFRDRDSNSRDGEGRSTRIRRVMGFMRPRREAEQRTFTPWRPPVSGHSTFRFDA